MEASTLHSSQNRGNLAQQLHTQERTSITIDGSKKVTAMAKDATGAGVLSFSPVLHGSECVVSTGFWAMRLAVSSRVLMAFMAGVAVMYFETAAKVRV